MNKHPRIPKHLYNKRFPIVLMHITFTWIVIIACWLLTLWANHLSINILTFILIGVMQYHLNILGHDGIHYLLSKNKKLNDCLCLGLLHSPVGAPLSMLRKNHLNHHQQLGLTSDSDSQYYKIEHLNSGNRFVLWLIGSCFGGMTLSIIKKLVNITSKNPQSSMAANKDYMKLLTDKFSVLKKEIIMIVVIQMFIATFLYMLFGSMLYYFTHWLLPILTIMFGLNTIRSCLEHAHSNSHSNHRYHSFSPNFIERFLLSPFNMNYHAEHHFYPGVAFHQLPQLHQYIQHNPMSTNDIFYHRSYLSRCLNIKQYLDKPH